MTSPFSLIPLASIETSDRLRPLEPANVEALAASIGETGLLEPIVVRPAPAGNGVRLVAGFHRLAAARALGWDEIAAVTLDLSDAEARLVEIDENLIRRELNALDRAIFLAERKRIHEELHPEARHGGDRKKAVKDQVAMFATWSRFSAEAAKKTNLSERSIQLAIEWVSKLSPEIIAAIRASSIVDNQAQLIRLADLPAEQQLKTAQALAAGAPNVERARVAAQLIPDIKTDPEKAALQAFVVAMERLTPKQLQKRADIIGGIMRRKEMAKQAEDEAAARAKAQKLANKKATRG